MLVHVYVGGVELIFDTCVLCRNARGQGSLRELLNPLVKKVIDDKSMVINTNPVEVYKAWVNQMESQSGKTR